MFQPRVLVKLLRQLTYLVVRKKHVTAVVRRTTEKNFTHTHVDALGNRVEHQLLLLLGAFHNRRDELVHKAGNLPTTSKKKKKRK